MGDDTARSRTFPFPEEAPLPEPARVFYAGCPGCAMERKIENNTGIPYKELVFVGVTSLASGTYIQWPI